MGYENKRNLNDVKKEFNTLNKKCGNQLILISVKYESYRSKKTGKVHIGKRPEKKWVIYFKCKKKHEDYKTINLIRRSGANCSYCSGYRLSIEERIEQLKKRHNSYYSYDEFLKYGYKGPYEKIPIRCPKHGIYKSQTYHGHHTGKGCPKCGGHTPNSGKEIKKYVKENSNGFISVIDLNDNDLYPQNIKCKIKCNVHKWHPVHTRLISSLFDKDSGFTCTFCSASSYVLIAYHTLNQLGVDYEFEHHIQFKDKSNAWIDIVITDKNGIKTFIEIDGQYHFKVPNYKNTRNTKAFIKTKLNDKKKDDYARSNRIKLIRIKYTDNIKDKITKIIKLGNYNQKQVKKNIDVGKMNTAERKAYEMLKMYKKGFKNKEIAEKFSVKSAYVSKILHGQRFKNLFLHFYPSNTNTDFKGKKSYEFIMTKKEKDFLIKLLKKKELSQVAIRKKFQEKFKRELTRGPLFNLNKKLKKQKLITL
tara:strand:- start:46 stop:1470 length:1425 start_codon:yes stop_codon:yes gene_type:complete